MGENHPTDGLNEHHLRRLLVSCQYIDQLLSDIENILDTPRSNSVFPKYFMDTSAAERRLLEQHIARIREHLVRIAREYRLEQQPSIPARRAIHSILSVIQISAEELNPGYLRGYGQVPEEAAARLRPLVGELQGLVGSLDDCIKPDSETGRR